MRVLPFGDRALLAEYDSLDETVAAHRALERSRPRGVLELVPAARTVLVRLDPERVPLGTVASWLRRVAPDPDALAAGSAPARRVVTIPVVYDGPDLTETAALLGRTIGELVRLHTTVEWRCAFVGFAPGFGYLASPGLDLGVPRLATSRPRVPAGSVALAGEFSAVYPRESPGGWRLIGRTDVVLWDERADPPALLPPGTRVRFAAATP